MRPVATTIGAVVLVCLVRPEAEPRAPALGLPAATEAEAGKGYGRLPLRFERNQGQVAKPARYLSRGPGYTLFVTPTAMALSLGRGDGRAPKAGGRKPSAEGPRSLGHAVLRVKLLQARSNAKVEGLEELPGKTSYFIGSDPRRWRRNVPGYARVRCRGVYPGIDLVYHGRHRQLEFDFVVAPGADPGRIRLGFEGARSLRVDGAGSLVVALEGGEVVQRAPRVYQKAGPREDPVGGRWALHGAREARFEVGPYDKRRALVIDPVLIYSTFLGGSGDEWGEAIAVDGSGSAYVAGWTSSVNFPTLTAEEVVEGDNDAFVAKLSPSGDTLVYSTYLGGDDDDFGSSIAVDTSGSAYVTGQTFSTNFPTQNPFQADQGSQDAFVTKLSPTGDSLAYSTYLGGSAGDYGTALAVDSSGSAYVTGLTDSTNFPTQSPYQTDQAGSDGFVAKLSPPGGSLVYSTYLGGSSLDYGSAIAVDSSGSAYVAGLTYSIDFPTQNPYQAHQSGADAFVTKLSPSGDSLVYSTHLGGGDYDQGLGVAVDSSGSAYISGVTYSTDFPTQNPYQTYHALSDAFVTRLSPSGAGLVYSTYLGGSGGDSGVGIATDGVESAYVTGSTSSPDFPAQDSYQTYQASADVFVTKLGPPPPTGFFTVSPCRLIDTRDAPGPYGGPALAAGSDRVFTLAGQCGISSKARSVSVNMAVTQPSAMGNLRLYPAGGALPSTSSLNYTAGQTRSNNAIVLLTSGGITVRCSQGSGTVHLILDVNGYFE